MNPISIRRCQPGDELALSLIGQATFLEAYAGVIWGQDIVGHCQRQHSSEKYAAWLSNPASAVWLVESEPGRAPIGFLVLSTPDLPLAGLTPADIEIKRIYLLNRFHGLGFGAKLMEQAHTEAKARGCRRMLLGVYQRNATAIAFYEKFGFQRVGDRQFHVGENTYDDFILGLTLTN